MANEYKLLKEAFVSNLNGGTITEINLVTLVAPASVLLWSALQAKLSLFTPYDSLAALIDFQLNCAAILYATTILSGSPVLLNSLLVIPAIILLLSSHSTKKPPARKVPPSAKKTNAGPPDPLPVKPFVTAYRGTMLVVTCVAILAVDFRVFPRRFAKVENWGTSLMDIGVGSFVFSAGTVAARPILKEKLSSTSHGLATKLRSAFRHSFPLLVLGLIRLYTVKGLDYAEHVTEYGVHWNFFFTMAFIPPLMALFDSAFRLVPSYALLSILLSLSYQILLDSTDLKAFILTSPRYDLLSKNREGVFSFFGYLAIFLAGQGTGTYILPRYPSPTSLRSNKLLRKLLIWSAVWCSLFLLVTNYSFGAGIQVSRRLANLPYVLWINAFNSCQILLFALVESLLFPNIYSRTGDADERQMSNLASSRLLRAFNRNGLALFLLANLLTGLVNLTVPTLEMGNLQAMAILLVYMGTLSAVALLLDAKGISIKL